MAQTLTDRIIKPGQSNYSSTPADGSPQGELSEHDTWILGNPEVLASVKQGLADSAAGRVTKRASYAGHAEDTLED